MKGIVNRVKRVMEEINTFLGYIPEIYDSHIDCILLNPDTNEAIAIINCKDEQTIVIPPYTKEKEINFLYVPKEDYNFDEYIFKKLENVYQVGFMSDNLHCSIWETLDELYPKRINNKDGVQMYLQFCTDNGITKEYLDEKMHLDMPNVLENFKGLSFFESMEYKGYIIEADDLNLDNNQESLVNIYENKADFDKREPIETVSLNTIRLKQNIKDYIDKVYFSKNIKIVDKHPNELLNDEFKSSSEQACHEFTHDYYQKIIGDYFESDYYKGDFYNDNEMFKKYVKDNKAKILKEYGKTIGFKNIYYRNNQRIIETRVVGGQPVALIEWGKGNNKEYIVTIGYRIYKDKIYFDKGFYYMDKNKAKNHFCRVANIEYMPSKNKGCER